MKEILKAILDSQRDFSVDINRMTFQSTKDNQNIIEKLKSRVRLLGNAYNDLQIFYSVKEHFKKFDKDI